MTTLKLNRRDFLKLTGLASLSWAAPQFLSRPALEQPDANNPNILIVVFDALTAANISLYGYPRDTMPNLARLAEKATVFHNHYSPGNFTTPGTASLLTGVLPWTHRALSYSDTVTDVFVDQNIFQLFNGYHRLVYSHNPLVNTLFDQFFAAIDQLTPQGRLFLEEDAFLHTLFKNDEDIATISWLRTIRPGEVGASYSLLLPRLHQALKRGRSANFARDFPRGLPNTYETNAFLLEHAIDWLSDQLAAASQPFLGYYHFFPPHFPYNTRQEFFGRFADDGYRPIEKPEHVFVVERARGHIQEWRTWYDEFLLYVDAEFARLYDLMEQRGLLENTWLVLTSDHGEMFERGVSGHQTPALYRPVMHIPLVIFEPGNTTRRDVTTPTSAIDLLPTLLHLTGQQIPSWVEGGILPPYQTASSNDPRDIFGLHARGTDKTEPLLRAGVMLLRENYKMTRHFGFDEFEGENIELYDLQKDPEELENLYPTRQALSAELLDIMQQKLDQVEEIRLSQLGS